MSIEQSAAEALGSFFQQTLGALGALVVADLPWLVPAMVVIFGLVQLLKIVVAAIRRKKKHGLPKIVVICGVLIIGVLYAWGAGYRHHHPCSFAMILEGIGLGSTNISLYHIGYFLFWLFFQRKEKK